MRTITILAACIAALILSCRPEGIRVLFEDDSGYDPMYWKMSGTAGPSTGAILFCKTPVPKKYLHYDITFRQYRTGFNYIGYIIGAREMDPGQGIEFGWMTRVSGTDSTGADAMITGAFGEKVMAGMGLMDTWADQRIEVRDNWVAWYINDTLVSLAELYARPIHGYFGIRQEDSTGARFDNVKITGFF
jgi:hypothetical protein